MSHEGRSVRTKRIDMSARILAERFLGGGAGRGKLPPGCEWLPGRKWWPVDDSMPEHFRETGEAQECAPSRQRASQSLRQHKPLNPSGATLPGLQGPGCPFGPVDAHSGKGQGIGMSTGLESQGSRSERPV